MNKYTNSMSHFSGIDTRDLTKRLRSMKNGCLGKVSLSFLLFKEILLKLIFI